MFDACHGGMICDLGWELTVTENGFLAMGDICGPRQRPSTRMFSAAQDNNVHWKQGSGRPYDEQVLCIRPKSAI